jgi:hypothetical protein
MRLSACPRRGFPARSRANKEILEHEPIFAGLERDIATKTREFAVSGSGCLFNPNDHVVGSAIRTGESSVLRLGHGGDLILVPYTKGSHTTTVSDVPVQVPPKTLQSGRCEGLAITLARQCLARRMTPMIQHAARTNVPEPADDSEVRRRVLCSRRLASGAIGAIKSPRGSTGALAPKDRQGFYRARSQTRSHNATCGTIGL